jgi:hypothetical protein
MWRFGKVTASTLMAMQWSFSRPVLVVVLLACTTTTTRYFIPSKQNPVYRPAQAAPVLTEYLRLQCPAFRKASLPDSGVVRFSVSVDTSGFASRAELRQGSGDEIIDDVFGTVAAQLIFPRDSSRRSRERIEPVLMHYACRGDSASVVVR